MQILHAVILLLCAPCPAAQKDFPPGIGSCYDPYCDISFAYCSAESNASIIPYRSRIGSDKICVFVEATPEDWFCTDPHPDWTIVIPGCFKSATVVEIYEFDGSNWSQWAARHLVREIGPLPEDFHVSWVHMDRNAFGRLDDGRLFTHYKANVVAIENGDSMELSVLDGSDLLVTNSGSNIDSDDRDVEPGTFFFTIAPVHSAFNVSTVVLKNYGYMEFLMSKKRILEHRRFAIRQDAPAAKAVVIDVHGSSGPLQGILGQSRRPRSEKHTENASGKGRPIHVCIWGSSKLDGQKSIWINQVQHMNEQTFDGVRYTFTWILTSNTTGPGTPEVLSDLPTPPQILSSPFENLGIDIDDLNQDPGDGSPPFAAIWDKTPEGITQYILDRLALTENRMFEAVSPLWVRNFLLNARQKVGSIGCGLMVYGSNRGFSNDALIVMMGKELHIPTLSELLNLFPDARNLPDVIIGPSHYSLHHDSIVGLLHADVGVRVNVIPPGIDLNRFDIGLRYADNTRWKHPGCTAGGEFNACVVLGFMARIAVEKNPGLFVLCAWEVHRRYPETRFVMIGDGPLLSNIQELVLTLGMESLFYFPGWLIGSSLPEMLAGIDIMLNPSLRAWSETFCIANIEAMAMGIPLVTFAVGGVGEYIAAPKRCAMTVGFDKHPQLSAEWHTSACNSDMDIDSVPNFEVVSNAIVLNHAAPTIILEAISYLMTNRSERIRIGSAGRATIVKHFSTSRQMKQYSALYKEIHTDYYLDKRSLKNS